MTDPVPKHTETWKLYISGQFWQNMGQLHKVFVGKAKRPNFPLDYTEAEMGERTEHAYITETTLHFCRENWFYPSLIAYRREIITVRGQSFVFRLPKY